MTKSVSRSVNYNWLVWTELAWLTKGVIYLRFVCNNMHKLDVEANLLQK